MMWRKLRIVILLFVLATVAQQAWLSDRDLDWGDNLYVALYPVNVDGSAKVAAYIRTLIPQQFEPLTEYFSAQAQRYGLAVYHPFAIRLGDTVQGNPPLPPRAASAVQAMWWSLKFRWWAWRHSPAMQVKPKIRLYLLYHDPGKVKALSHSTALSKGRVGLVNLFGDPAADEQNMVIVAHELLHTVGATDKYDLAMNRPLFPDGYAEPERTPRHPQKLAELMAGRIPVSESEAEIPQNLQHTVIGPATAREIQWVKTR
jgi:hypothetical protein